MRSALVLRADTFSPSTRTSERAQRDHRLMEADRTASEIHVLACVECPRVSTATARGWKAHRVDDPDEEGPPELAFYCPACAP